MALLHHHVALCGWRHAELHVHRPPGCWHLQSRREGLGHHLDRALVASGLEEGSELTATSSFISLFNEFLRQYGLVVAVALATMAFCHSEAPFCLGHCTCQAHARQVASRPGAKQWMQTQPVCGVRLPHPCAFREPNLSKPITCYFDRLTGRSQNKVGLDISTEWASYRAYGLTRGTCHECQGHPLDLHGVVYWTGRTICCGLPDILGRRSPGGESTTWKTDAGAALGLHPRHPFPSAAGVDELCSYVAEPHNA